MILNLEPRRPATFLQPGFNPYTCTLITGEQLYGLLATESSGSVVLKLADGAPRTVLRNQIKTLQSHPQATTRRVPHWPPNGRQSGRLPFRKTGGSAANQPDKSRT